MQLPKIAQSLLTPLNHRHALAMSFFFSVPAHWNPMQWDIWAGHERRVAFWFYTKKKKKLKKLKAQYTKRKARNKYFIMTSAKKIVTQTRETQMKNKAIRQKKISMPRWLFPSF